MSALYIRPMKRISISVLTAYFLFSVSCQKANEAGPQNNNSGYNGPAMVRFTYSDSVRTWVGDKDSVHATGAYAHISHQFNYVQSDFISASAESMWWRINGQTGLDVSMYPYQIPGSALVGFINIAGNTWYYDSSFVLTITNVHKNMVDGKFSGSCHLIVPGATSPYITISEGEFKNVKIFVED